MRRVDLREVPALRPGLAVFALLFIDLAGLVARAFGFRSRGATSSLAVSCSPPPAASGRWRSTPRGSRPCHPPTAARSAAGNRPRAARFGRDRPGAAGAAPPDRRLSRSGSPRAFIWAIRFSMRLSRMPSSTLSSITASSLRPFSLSMRSSAWACGTVRGKPSRTKPLRASGWAMRSADDRHHHVVRHQLAARHDLLGVQPDRRTRRDRGAQHIAGRELHDAVLGDESLRLRAFAGPRRAEQYQPHLRRPRSFDRLIRPSYWCASK